MQTLKEIIIIDDIKNLDFETAKSCASEIIKIKDHDCCFIKLSPPFGYSALVFANNRQISSANEYQSHWPDHKTITELREKFIANLNNKLYTYEELMTPVTTYEEYRLKIHYLRKYDIQKHDYTNMFNMDCWPEESKEYPYFSNASHCYVKNEEITKYQDKILNFLNAEYDKLKKNNESFREMIRYELANREIGIGYLDCDHNDALRALDLEFENLTPDQQMIVRYEIGKQIEEQIEDYEYREFIDYEISKRIDKQIRDQWIREQIRKGNYDYLDDYDD